MKNNITDMDNALFCQLERLNDEGLKPKEIKAEAQRSRAMCQVAGKLLESGDLQLKARRFASDLTDRQRGNVTKSPLLGFEQKDK